MTLQERLDEYARRDLWITLTPDGLRLRVRGNPTVFEAAKPWLEKNRDEILKMLRALTSPDRGPRDRLAPDKGAAPDKQATKTLSLTCPT